MVVIGRRICVYKARHRRRSDTGNVLAGDANVVFAADTSIEKQPAATERVLQLKIHVIVSAS
jgi:hypothetical protein